MLYGNHLYAVCQHPGTCAMFAADREAGYGHASQRRLAAVRVNAINKEEKKNPDLFLMPCFPLEAPPTLDMRRTVNRPLDNVRTIRALRDSDAYTCTSHPLMIAIPCVLKPR